MGKIFQSVAWGCVGAVLAGLIVAVIGFVFGLTLEVVVTAAAPTGMAFGAFGLSIVWWRPAVARIRNR